MKKNLVIRILFIIVFSIIVLFSTKESCAALEGVDPAGAGGWSYTDAGVVHSTKRVMGTGINVIRIVGTGISIIMLTYVAIKYMSAAPAEKAEFKKSATAMVVGAIVLFAATNILSIISAFASNNIS